MEAYIALAKRAIANHELLWPSRPNIMQRDALFFGGNDVPQKWH